MPRTVDALADDLGVDAEDIRVIAAWLTPEPDLGENLDSVLDAALCDLLDPDGERTARERACPGCGRMPAPGLILAGWHPCRCGGHRTIFCRDDVGGCGHERFDPELSEGCRDPAFGFSTPR